VLRVYVSIRQHTSAYVSIRQHTSAYVSIRQHTCYAERGMREAEGDASAQHSAYVSIRAMRREACGRQRVTRLRSMLHTAMRREACGRQRVTRLRSMRHTSAYVSIRAMRREACGRQRAIRLRSMRHTSAYVSIRAMRREACGRQRAASAQHGLTSIHPATSRPVVGSPTYADVC
jgi:hypothetical protein